MCFVGDKEFWDLTSDFWGVFEEESCKLLVREEIVFRFSVYPLLRRSGGWIEERIPGGVGGRRLKAWLAQGNRGKQQQPQPPQQIPFGDDKQENNGNSPSKSPLGMTNKQHKSNSPSRSPLGMANEKNTGVNCRCKCGCRR